MDVCLYRYEPVNDHRDSGGHDAPYRWQPTS